jgi:hypothetical protein
MSRGAARSKTPQKPRESEPMNLRRAIVQEESEADPGVACVACSDSSRVLGLAADRMFMRSTTRSERYVQKKTKRMGRRTACTISEYSPDYVVSIRLPGKGKISGFNGCTDSHESPRLCRGTAYGYLAPRPSPGRAGGFHLAFRQPIQSYIKRLGAMGEAADADAFDAGFGDGAHRVEADAAGGFEFDAGRC